METGNWGEETFNSLQFRQSLLIACNLPSTSLSPEDREMNKTHPCPYGIHRRGATGRVNKFPE